jgi:trans-aconitate methyltransferase
MMIRKNWLIREARRLNKARALLQGILPLDAGTWVDLGCGDGIFTVVLAETLPLRT